jgi:hypothetical protein
MCGLGFPTSHILFAPLLLPVTFIFYELISRYFFLKDLSAAI